MKKNIIIAVILAAVVGIYFITNKSEVVAPVVSVETEVKPTDLTERESVEDYLRTNISTLSPVPAVLGGTWYVISLTIDLEKNSGAVIYEDGHVQEKRNFSYTTNEKMEVANMIFE